MGRFSWLATSSESEPEYDDGEFFGPETKGFLTRCFYCHGDMIVETEKDPRFIGRLWFKCTNAGDGLTAHESKWWDESVTEEIESLKQKAGEQSETLKALTTTNEGEVIDHSEALNRLRVVEGKVVSLGEEMEKCREQIVKFREDLKQLLDKVGCVAQG